MNKSLLTLGFGALLLTACGGAEKSEETENEVVDTKEVCKYEYNHDETILTWTAFKLTDKIAVTGSFDQIDVTTNQASEDMYAVVSGASFEIPVSSLNSQDETRDPKIKNSFFGVMDSTSTIVGSILSLDANGGKVEITMNGKTVQYDGKVKVDGEELKFLTEINILDFDGQEAMDSLGVVCEAKHTGPDGVNKLWSEVEIAVKTTFTKTCE
ncbi:YceI family protein [Crocinitomix algicola]|uniref:YceI family protein n=1 Tax=Crocinitomix algicola TaxID=1740263 RepID=UPI0008295FF1|nr:YceI family protein [Crocinitomix algicola]